VARWTSILASTPQKSTGKREIVFCYKTVEKSVGNS
jgi:hypothetical protein